MRYLDKWLLRIREYARNINVIDPQAKIGKHCLVRASVIQGPVAIGEGCRISKVLVKGNVTVGRYTSIWGPGTELHAQINTITIGSFCSIASNVTFQEYNHDPTRFTTYFIGKNFLSATKQPETISKGAINVGHDVWIGTHCVILSGATIGTGAVIAANSVVTGEIPPYAIAAGSPAKVIKFRFDEETCKKLLDTAWWTWDRDTMTGKMDWLASIVQKKG